MIIKAENSCLSRNKTEKIIFGKLYDVLSNYLKFISLFYVLKHHLFLFCNNSLLTLFIQEEIIFGRKIKPHKGNKLDEKVNVSCRWDTEYTFEG